MKIMKMRISLAALTLMMSLVLELPGFISCMHFRGGSLSWKHLGGTEVSKDILKEQKYLYLEFTDEILDLTFNECKQSSDLQYLILRCSFFQYKSTFPQRETATTF